MGASEARAREPVGFEEMVRPYLAYLYGLAVRLCRNRTTAEDLVQEALLRAFRGFSRLRNRERPRLWLTRVLISCHYDRLRDEQRAGETVSVDDQMDFDLFDKIVEEDPFPYSDRVHLDFLDLFDDERIVEVLRAVHPASRTALVLAYVYGYKAREIAEITGTPVGTVLSRLSRARKQLERELWEYAERNHLFPRTGVPA